MISSKQFFGQKLLVLVITVMLVLYMSCSEEHSASSKTNSNHLGQSDVEQEKVMPRAVEIKKIGGRFQLYRNGSPFLIKGAAGRAHLASLKKMGGNALRTYTADGLDTLLDQAHELGLAVMVGLWVGREMEGFDYKDSVAVRKQKERIREIIIRYKNHPAVLCWAIGNEPDNSSKQTHLLWPSLNELAIMIHQLDQNHPVTIPVYSKSIREVQKNCPNIDFLSANSFGALPDFVNNYDESMPYVITEWGSLGFWECAMTSWHAPLEESIIQKYERVRDTYTNYITADSNHCMGSFVFYWGQRQETTPTWFSFFLNNGAKTVLVDLMSELWNGSSVSNRAPFLDSIIIDGRGADSNVFLHPGKLYSAVVRSSDPEQDAIDYRWEILKNGPFYTYIPGKGRREVPSKSIPDLVAKQQGTNIQFKAPVESGSYRMMIYAFDGQGNGSYGNMPFYVLNNNLVDIEE